MHVCIMTALLLTMYRLLFDKDSKTDSLIIVQCDSGHLYSDLIACARYRVDDEREKSSGKTHVLFIVHLPRGGGGGGDGDSRLGSFVGFQGGKWLSAHIDDLRAPREEALSLDDALHKSISDLFYCEETYVEDVEEDEQKEEQDVEKEEEDMEKEDEHVEKKEQEKRAVVHVATSKASSYQCSRLYNCIQAAVARAGNSKAIRRVEILLSLVPQQPKLPLMSIRSSLSLSDDSLFYATLVRHIHSVLRQREVVGEETKWVIEEAMDGKRLQSGGTFRNVLSRKLDEVITPIFSEVLVRVDRYSNLDLLKRKGAPPYVQQLWLSAFACPALCSFSYTEMSVQGRDVLAGMGQRKSLGGEFSCRFPFFWLIKETVDSHWDAAIAVTGKTH